MNKEFSYKIVRENRIILERFNSVANLQNVMEASLAIWSDPGYNKNYNGLADLRGCKVEFGLKEIAKLFMFFANNANTAKGRLAILVDNPDATARSYLFQNKLSGILKAKVFSTTESAADFLGVEVVVLEDF